MLNMIRADLYKMHKSPVIKILFGITTLSATIMTVLAYLISKGQIGAGMTGIGFMFSDVNMISILGAAIAGIFICGDFDNKTIHDAIACGCSRGAVIVSKAIVFFSAVAFILIPYVIITGIAISSGSDYNMGEVAVSFLNLIVQESGTIVDASTFLKLLMATITLMIVYMAQLSICVPLALLLKKPILVATIYYGFNILCAQITRLSNSSSVLDSILSVTPYGGDYAFITLNTGMGVLVKAIVVSLIYIIGMLAVTYSIFRKSEIK